MALGFRELRDALHEGKGLGEVLEPERPFDALRLAADLPRWDFAPMALDLVPR
jgi:hypothetical protein